MSKSDDQRAQILDDRFDEILDRLKPYLLDLPASNDKRNIRLWLERFGIAENQRSFRNDYLLALYRQLKSGYLSAPFNKPPETGSLKPLTSLLHTQETSSSCNELTEMSPSVCEQPRCWPKQRSKSLHRSNIHQNKTGWRFRNSINSCDDNPFSTPVHFHQQNKNNRYEKNLLRTYKKRIETLSTIVEELEIQNEKLKQKIIYCENSTTTDDTTQSHTRIEKLIQEIANLKNKLIEVQELKAVLENHHKEIVEQYKIKMTEQFKNMKHHLENARRENEELNDKVLLIEGKMQEINNQKEDSIKLKEDVWIEKIERTKADYEKNLKEKDLLIQERDQMVYQRDMELTKKLDEIDSLCEQIQKLQYLIETRTQEPGGKLQDILMEQHKIIMGELSKMRSNLEMTSQQQTETHQQEILLLKKIAQKFEKYAHKLREEYEKQICHIIKVHNKEIMNLESRIRNNSLKNTISEKCGSFNYLERQNKFLNSLNPPADDNKKYCLTMSNSEDKIENIIDNKNI